MELYPLLMQHFIMPIAGRFTDIRLWNEYRSMMQLEELGYEELERHQFSKLHDIISHAYERVPFYRRRFEEIGLHPKDIKHIKDIAAIPPITKDDIMSNFPEGITAQGLDRSRWRYVASSGTTRQIMGIHDFRKANLNWAAGLRAHKLAGNHDVGKKWMEIPPHMCTNICGIDDRGKEERFFSRKVLSLLLKADFSSLGRRAYEQIYSKRNSIYRRITLPSFGSKGTNISEEDLLGYISAISEYRPYLLEGLPVYIYTFAKYLMNRNGRPPKVGIIKPFGGSMTPLMKEMIRKAFNCDVYDTYGCSEMGFVACDCKRHEGLHLFMDLYHIDFCRNGKPVRPGELGKLYITDLENRAMPWIRYDVGDVGRYFLEDHGCGRKSIRIQVEGRIEDTICNSKGEAFSSDTVFDFFHTLEGLDNFQLIEESKGEFALYCVPKNGANIDKYRVSKEFGIFFDPNVSVRVYIVNTIRAEDGGKFRFVKSKSFHEI